MASQLITKLRTKEDLDILRGELDILENALYQSSDIYNNVLRNDIRNWVSETISKETSKEDLKNYILKTKEDLKSIPILSVSIFFDPSNSFIESISTWLKRNIDEKLVVDILQNTSMLGGLQLSYKGKYLDLSLRKRITRELESLTLTRTKQA